MGENFVKSIGENFAKSMSGKVSVKFCQMYEGR